MDCDHPSVDTQSKAYVRNLDLRHQSSRHRVGLLWNTLSGSVCQVCSRQPWTTWRLKEHLRRSEPCRQACNHADLDPPQNHEYTGRRDQTCGRPPTSPTPIEPESQTGAIQNCLTRLHPCKKDVGSWFLRMYRIYLEQNS